MSTITNVTITALHTDVVVGFDCADLSVKQTVTPSWAEETAYGKMDPIATYARTGRTATIDMIVIAQTLNEAASLQLNVEGLYKINYPAYTGNGSSLLAPPFFKVEVLHGHMFSALKGFFTEVAIAPGSDQEIVPLVGTNGQFYERRYDITLGMTVLHDRIPGWGAGGSFGGDGGGGFVYAAPNASAVRLQQGIEGMKKLGAQMKEVATELGNAVSSLGLTRGATAESLKDGLTTQSKGSDKMKDKGE